VERGDLRCVIVAMKKYSMFLFLLMAACVDTTPHRPMALALLIDSSRSMDGAKLDEAVRGAEASLDELQPGDEFCIVTFDSEAHIVVPLTRLSAATRADASERLQAVHALGGTALTPALTLAFTSLRNSTLAIKHVIVLSDGDSPSMGVDSILRQMSSEGMTLSSIALRLDGDAASERDSSGENTHRMQAQRSVMRLADLTAAFVDETRGARKAPTRR
jgi:hypothetical protein